ncbi:arylamine N-acetyltransferase family protein [Dickeya chrysanthemi]|uniref:Arylamine N-acetyltransferase n=1 Tax=Dickeya chrysanthemi TaxID=556 RepID=A0ABU8JKH4_DICCH|nr:arylamine N-acetyltransferase [Dickeya chrysanthemi]MBX9444345.1 arylamine N-acetyltransferase [Dickeya chrysanthemi]MCA7006448.1 arylamine N-acetyltransferase [Dickeya chrysanthemi]
MLNHSEVQRYLQRIGVSALPAEPALQLRTLHLAHLMHIPFENLDVVFGKPIPLNQSAIYRKIVDDRRGGFCYELNYGFYLLLQALGFEVQLLAGQVWNDDGHYGQPFDHLFLKVELPQSAVIADISFGDSFCVPVPLSGTVSDEAFARYRVVTEAGEYQLQQQQPGKAWKTQYKFTLQPHQLAEYAGMAHYHQTSPLSPFTNKALCTRVTPEGRLTLSDNRLIVTRQGQKSERLIGSHRDYLDCLQQHFGIVLADDYDSQHWFARLTTAVS